MSSKRYTSKADVARLFLQQDGNCAKCGCRLSLRYNIDHIIALARGGEDVFENKHVLCIPCHKIKTFGTKATSYGSDIHEIRKGDRLRGETKPKVKSRWPSRPFRRKNAKPS